MIRLAQRYLNTPANVSESQPVCGPDALTLGDFSIRDMDKVLGFSVNIPQAWLLKSFAHAIRRDYLQAKEAALKGLEYDPMSPALNDQLKKMSSQLSSSPRTSTQTEIEACPLKLSQPPSLTGRISDDLECPVCMKLLFHPVTTPCGHTFCKPCLMRAYDHKNTCPFCRTLLMLNPDQAPLTMVLHNYLKANFAEEYQKRQSELTLDCNGAIGNNILTERLPLFVMTNLLPGEEVQLNVFEPRYRLMFRRIMETNRRLGLLGLHADGSLPNIACVGQVKECIPQQDGRLHVIILSVNRVRIISCEDVDGYRVATVEKFLDYRPPCPQQKQDVVALGQEVRVMIVTWTENVLRCGSTQLRECVASVGPIPDVRTICDAEALSFWIPRVMPLPQSEKDRMLYFVTTRERLLALKELMTHSSCPLAASCCIM